jgi:hypothetical protein
MRSHFIFSLQGLLTKRYYIDTLNILKLFKILIRKTLSFFLNNVKLRKTTHLSQQLFCINSLFNANMTKQCIFGKMLFIL